MVDKTFSVHLTDERKRKLEEFVRRVGTDSSTALFDLMLDTALEVTYCAGDTEFKLKRAGELLRRVRT